MFIAGAGNFIDLNPAKYGGKIQVDTGCIVAFEDTITYGVERVGALNTQTMMTAMFGGEGLSLATLEGDGQVILQSMTIEGLAKAIVKNMGIGDDKKGPARRPALRQRLRLIPNKRRKGTTSMGLMDKVKAQAEQAVAKGKQGVAQGQAKVGEMQAKKATGNVLHDLGAAYYAEQREGGSHDAVLQALAAADAAKAAAPAGGAGKPDAPAGNYSLGDV